MLHASSFDGRVLGCECRTEWSEMRSQLVLNAKQASVHFKCSEARKWSNECEANRNAFIIFYLVCKHLGRFLDNLWNLFQICTLIASVSVKWHPKCRSAVPTVAPTHRHHCSSPLPVCPRQPVADPLTHAAMGKFSLRQVRCACRLSGEL